MAIELIEAFAHHDSTALAALTPGQRAEQMNARKALYNHVKTIWEDAKARGLDPATRPEWKAVAGLCDLTSVLWEQAAQAVFAANDEPA